MDPRRGAGGEKGGMRFDFSLPYIRDPLNQKGDPNPEKGTQKILKSRPEKDPVSNRGHSRRFIDNE
jgi:hypothetical protein